MKNDPRAGRRFGFVSRHFGTEKKSENQEKKQGGFPVRETLLLMTAIGSSFVLLFELCGGFIFGELGLGLRRFLMGVLGYVSYPFFFALAALGFCAVFDKKIHWPARKVIPIAFAAFFAVCILETATSASLESTSYGVYLSACYRAGASLKTSTVGGWVFALVTYPLLRYTTAIGSYAIFGVLFVVSVAITVALNRAHKKAEGASAQQGEAPVQPVMEVPAAPVPPVPPEEGFVPAEAGADNVGQAESPAAEETAGGWAAPGTFSDPVIQGSVVRDVPASEESTQPTPVSDQLQQPYDPYANQPMMAHADSYLRSVAHFERNVSNLTEQTQSPYLHCTDPNSSYQKRNAWFDEVVRQQREKQGQTPNEAFAHRPLFEDAPKAPVLPPEGEDRRSAARAMLFSGSQARQHYQENLIFDSESSYNNRGGGTWTDGVPGGYKEFPEYDRYAELHSSDGQPAKIIRDTTIAPQTASHRERTIESVPFTGGGYYGGNAYSGGYGGSGGTVKPTAARPEEKPAERPMERSAEWPAGRPMERPVERPAGRPMERSAEWPAGSPMERPAERPAGSPMERPAERPAGSPMERPAERPAETPGEMPERRGASGRPDLSISNIFSSNGNDTCRVQLDPNGTDRKFKGFDRILERQKRMEERRSRAGLFDDDTATSEPNADERSVSDRSVREENVSCEESSTEGREREISVAGSPVPTIPADPIVPADPPVPVEIPSSEETPSDVLEEEERFELPEEPARAEIRPVRKYSRPPLELFNSYNEESSVREEEIETNREVIVRTLAEFKIDVEVKRVTVGPSFTRYDIETPPGVVSTKIMGYERELGRKLHAEEVNVYPNYENGFMAIEVPNKDRSTVGLAPILRSPKFQSSKPNALTIALGKDVEGRCICGDISEMTHVLVAGSSGSGKSVFLNSLIVSLLMKYSPDELRLILIDPKLIEFVSYQGIPHLLINEIVNDPERVINVLDWISQEMDRRYHLFRECSEKGRLVRNVAEYNQGLAPDEVPLPKIVVIIDELADLMLKAKKEIENRIQELTQKSRASGIHLIIATQRPSVDVITGVIKSNMPTRIAFTVASFVDSKTILDEGGADKLLGKGDMIWKSSTGKSTRLQSAYLDSEEVTRVIGYIKENNEAVFDSDLAEFLANASRPQQTEEETDEVAIDPVNITALRYVVSIGQASISMVQRRCGVGYNRAGKIIEWMEQMGYVSAFDGAKSRKVLLTKEELIEKYGDETED